MRVALLLLAMFMVAVSAAAQEVDHDGFYREPFLVLDPGMHTATIKRLDADAAGRFLVTGSLDKTVRVWSTEDGRLLRTIRISAGPSNLGTIFAVAISPDGEVIAAGGLTGRPGALNIYIFKRATGQQIGRIGSLPNVIHHLAFSPDGSKLAAALGGGAGVRLFDARSWNRIAVDGGYGDDSRWIAFEYLLDPDLIGVLGGNSPTL